jgi:hypothetical protein
MIPNWKFPLKVWLLSVIVVGPSLLLVRRTVQRVYHHFDISFSNIFGLLDFFIMWGIIFTSNFINLLSIVHFPNEKETFLSYSKNDLTYYLFFGHFINVAFYIQRLSIGAILFYCSVSKYLGV